MVYASNAGMTKDIVKAIANHLNADLAEIRRSTPYRDLQSEAKGKIGSGAQPWIPFCASASSSIDNSLHIFREPAQGAVLTDGLTANGSTTAILGWADMVLASAA